MDTGRLPGLELKEGDGDIDVRRPEAFERMRSRLGEAASWGNSTGDAKMTFSPLSSSSGRLSQLLTLVVLIRFDIPRLAGRSTCCRASRCLSGEPLPTAMMGILMRRSLIKACCGLMASPGSAEVATCA